MPQSAVIRSTEIFDTFHFYTRSFLPTNYRKLVKKIGRKPRVIYPEGWFDHDIDRIMIGKFCVLFGHQEIKTLYSECSDLSYTEQEREAVTKILKSDHFKIESHVLHYTPHNRKGVACSNEANIYPISRDDYNNFLKSKRAIIDANPDQAGKGVFLFVIHNVSLESFSVINFTGAEYIIGSKVLNETHSKYPMRVQLYLKKASSIIQPCINEVLLFMIEAYIRGDFFSLYKHFNSNKRIRKPLVLEDNEKVISENFKDMGISVHLWLAFQDAMEWLLESLHFDTILEEAEEIRVPTSNYSKPSYLNLVKLCQSGEIFEYLAETIRRRYEYYERGRRRAS